MNEGTDPRIEIIFAAASGGRAGDALLIETQGLFADDGDAHTAPVAYFSLKTETGSGHKAGCSCCRPRGAVADALNTLFLSRARDEAGWFTRVLAVVRTQDGRRAIAQAVSDDALTAARFRLSAPQE